MSVRDAKRKTIGVTGEDIATLFLIKRGFRILDRNYRKPFGELDIVAGKDGVTHFVEVKSGLLNDVSYETLNAFVTHETTVTTRRPRKSVKHFYMANLVRGVVSCVTQPKPWKIAKFMLWDVRVTHETPRERNPEEHIDHHKAERMKRTVETYVAAKHIRGVVQIDVIAVLIDFSKKRAIIRLTENVVLE